MFFNFAVISAFSFTIQPKAELIFYFFLVIQNTANYFYAFLSLFSFLLF